MSDRYLKLFTSIAEHPKWRLRLKEDGARVAYIVALAKAKDAGGDGRFEGREHLELALGAYGIYVDQLIEAGLIDEIPDTGELWIHDFEERQRPLTTAERQAGWRRRHGVGRSPNRDEGGGGEGGDGTSPHGDNAVDNESRNAGRHSRRNAAVTKAVTEPVTRIRVEEIREDVYTREEELDSTARLFASIIRKTPSPKTIEALGRMTRDHGADLMADALRMEYALGGTSDLLKRTGKRLRREAQQRHDEYEAARRASEPPATKPDGITDEQAAERREAIAAFAAGFTMKGEG